MTACERIRAARGEVDFTVEDHGTIVLLRPVSPEVRAWLYEYIAGDHSYFGSALVVEHRYIEPIVSALEQAGFRW